MKIEFKLNEANMTTTHQLAASTYYGGKVFPYPLDALPEGIQQMPGLAETYITGYIKPETLTAGATALGEFLAVRDDNGQPKGYVWGIVITDKSKVFYFGPYKPEAHYFQSLDAIPYDRLFGQIPK